MSDFNFADPVPKGNTAKMPVITDEMLQAKPPEEYGHVGYEQQEYTQQTRYARYAAQSFQQQSQSIGRTCKRCGAPLRDNDKSCKRCGANVRPFYLRVWFWLLLVVFAILLGAGAYIFTHGASYSPVSDSSVMDTRDQDAPFAGPGDLLGGLTSSFTDVWAEKLMEHTPLGEVSFVNGVGMEGMTPVVYIDKAGMEAEGYTVDMLVEIANKALKEHSEEYGLEGLTDFIGAELTKDNFVLQ